MRSGRKAATDAVRAGQLGDHALTQTFHLARQHRLSTYDAAWLELAQRKGIPIATLDTDLRAAAEATGTPHV